MKVAGQELVIGSDFASELRDLPWYIVGNGLPIALPSIIGT